PRQVIDVYRPRITSIAVSGSSRTLDAIRAELINGCAGLLGGPARVAQDAPSDGAVIAGTPKSSPLIASLGWERELKELGPEGFLLRSVKFKSRSAIVIASDGEIGAL